MKFRDVVQVFSNKQDILVYNTIPKTLHRGTPRYLLNKKEVDGESDVILIRTDEIDSQVGTGSKETIIMVVLL